MQSSDPNRNALDNAIAFGQVKGAQEMLNWILEPVQTTEKK